MALSAKNKEGFIDETIKKPEGASAVELQQWTCCNNLVKSWLLNSIFQDIRVSVIYSDISHKIWNDLKERFSHVNNDKRDALCSIPNCTFRTMKEVLQFQQSQKTMKFLIGLNDAYATIRGQILLMDPLVACHKLKKANSYNDKVDYQDRKGFTSKANHVDINLTSPVVPLPSYGLTIEQYHHLLALFNKNKSNHMANHVSSVSSMNDLSGKALCASDFSEETSWIFDIEATYHIVCLPHLMTTRISITNRQVHLPNHALADGTHIGTIRFSNDLVLHNMLCVPSFRLNLIYVSKLAKTSSCFAILTDTLCMLQDQRSGKMIGMGTEREGLY
ncbi:uncharacterized protein [Malus domestica]|uniref:uncharacterized protein n=1 Tax=Malus domestica TaxID=3750 RepID=UPI00397576BF